MIKKKKMEIRQKEKTKGRVKSEEVRRKTEKRRRR